MDRGMVSSASCTEHQGCTFAARNRYAEAPNSMGAEKVVLVSLRVKYII